MKSLDTKKTKADVQDLVNRMSRALPKNDAMRATTSRANMMKWPNGDLKPDKPPYSAYQLFTTIMMQDVHIQELKSKDRFMRIGQLWKELPDSQRDDYQRDVDALKAEYKVNYASYLASLPEDQRAKEKESGKKRKGGKATRNKESDNNEEASPPLKKSKAASKTPPLLTSEELMKKGPQTPAKDVFSLYIDDVRKKYPILTFSDKDIKEGFDALTDEELMELHARLDAMKQAYKVERKKFVESLSPQGVNSNANDESRFEDSYVYDCSSDDGEVDEELKAEYKVNYASYLASLPEEQRAKEKESGNKKKRGKARRHEEGDNNEEASPPLKKSKAALKGDLKPDKPPYSAYQLFATIMMKDVHIQELKSKDRFMRIGQLWKELPDSRRDDYQRHVDALKAEYKVNYASYLASLPEEQRAKEKESGNKKKRGKARRHEEGDNNEEASPPLKKSKAASKTPPLLTSEELMKIGPQTPAKDVFSLYIDDVRKKYPTLTFSDKDFKEGFDALTDEELMELHARLDAMKLAYKVERKKFVESLSPQGVNSNANDESQFEDSYVYDCSSDDGEVDEEKLAPVPMLTLDDILKKQPEVPPLDIFQLFIRELKKQFPDMDISEKEAKTRLSALSNEQRADMHQKLDVLKRAYLADMQKFLKSLSRDEMVLYRAFQEESKQRNVILSESKGSDEDDTSDEDDDEEDDTSDEDDDEEDDTSDEDDEEEDDSSDEGGDE